MLIFILLLLTSVLLFLVIFWHSQIVPQTFVHLIEKADSPERGERILVLAPHPDDETIGAGGYLATALRRGAEVWVILVTDGNKRRQSRRRLKEFGRACSVLGVPAERRILWHYPDGSLRNQDPREIRQKLEKEVERIKPHLILAPHRHDIHYDHAVIGRVAGRVARCQGLMFYQYLVHFYRFPAPRGYYRNDYLLPPLRLSLDEDWRVFDLSPAVRELKEEALRGYRSQLRIRVMRDLLLSFLRRNELFAVSDYS